MKKTSSEKENWLGRCCGGSVRLALISESCPTITLFACRGQKFATLTLAFRNLQEISIPNRLAYRSRDTALSSFGDQQVQAERNGQVFVGTDSSSICQVIIQAKADIQTEKQGFQEEHLLAVSIFFVAGGLSFYPSKAKLLPHLPLAGNFCPALRNGSFEKPEQA